MQIVQNYSGSVFKEPFRHTIINNFLRPEIYIQLCLIMDQRLALGLSEEADRQNRFSRFKARPGDEEAYDAYGLPIAKSLPYPMNLLFSDEITNEFAKMFDVPLRSEKKLSFHHHKLGGRSGAVHSDFVTVQGEFAERMARSIALILYLNNYSWQEGDGGETGFYAKSKTPYELVTKVAPVNNRLLAFEVSPYSYHGFLTNTKNERNSIILWLHSDPAYMFERYGKWPKEPNR